MTRVTAFAVAAGSGALIWAASPWISGSTEPWDAAGPYYIGSLAAAGFVLGLVTRRRFLVYAGVCAGQLAYMIVALPDGPLILVGVMFLAAFSLIALVGAALAIAVRRAGVTAR